MHDTLTVGIPILAILFGILWNQRGLEKFESRVDQRLNRIDSRLDLMQADLSKFYTILGEHGGKIEVILRDRKS